MSLPKFGRSFQFIFILTLSLLVARARAADPDSPLFSQFTGQAEPIATRSQISPPDAKALITGNRVAAGTVLFYAGYPNLQNSVEMTRFNVYDDFLIEQNSVLHTIRFWTLEEASAWDGTVEYAILSDANQSPGSVLQTAKVDVTRVFIGSGPQGLSEYEYHFSLIAPLAVSAGNYWLGLHLSDTCNIRRGVYWETGTPGYRRGAIADEFCDNSGGLNVGVQLAFQVLGSPGAACVGLRPTQMLPVFSNRLTDNDRGVAVDIESEIRSSAISLMMTAGVPTNLTVSIRELTGKVPGPVIGGATVAIAAGGPRFFDVPVSFTFQKGKRYDIAFNVTGGWDDPSEYELELFPFNNQNFTASATYLSGPVRVIDGRGVPIQNSTDPYTDAYLPHIRICLAAPAFGAYGLDTATAGQRFLMGFNPGEPGFLTPIAPLPEAGANWVALDFRPGQGTSQVTMLDAGLRRLARMNVETGAVTNLGTVTAQSGQTFTGMSFDPTSSNLYACSAGSSTSALYRINPDTGSTTHIGAVSNAQALAGLAASQSGQLYGLDLNGDELIAINTTNGVGAVVGGLGLALDFSQGIDFNPVTNQLYGALFLPAPQRAELHQINTSTGAATFVGVLGLTFPGGLRQFSSLAFTSDLTGTPTPTATATSTSTSTATATPTSTSTSTSTATATATASPTPTPTSTVVFTFPPTNTPTPTPSIPPTPRPNSASVIKHTIPSEIIAGATQLVSVTMRNTGTATWTEAEAYRLGPLADPCELLPGKRALLPPGTSIAPGQDATFEFKLQAPAAAQTCSLTLGMLQEFVEFFGQTLSVEIAVGPTLHLDFQRNGGDDYGWSGAVLSGQGAVGSSPGLCMYVPDPGDNMVAWFSPAGYIGLKDLTLYRIRAAMTTDQAAANEIPLWDITYDNFDPGGSGNLYGGQGWLLDTAEGANGVGRPQGRSEFNLFAAPNSALTPQWRGLLGDGTAGAFAPEYDHINDMRVAVRVLDLASAPIAAEIDDGWLCLNSLRVDSVNLAAMIELGRLYGPAISNATHLPFTNTQSPMSAQIDDTRNVAVYQLGSVDRATLIPGSAPYGLPELYPVAWAGDTIYRASADLQIPAGVSGLDPIDAIFINQDTPTSEHGTLHFTTRGSQNNMFRAASPRPPEIAGAPQRYIGFFYGHNRTLIGIEDYARLRPMVDIFNVVELFGPDTGADPLEVHSLNSDVMSLP